MISDLDFTQGSASKVLEAPVQSFQDCIREKAK